eukprot:GHVQ01041162.1.p1 GENE.GHVQ01041162.1~~GHVQ01041162.1.p1  ORF type:complete len:1369 (+),score=244.11 GHVQ01041162.1:1150-5256(+)
MSWNHHSITVEIDGPIEEVFYLYHSVPDHPKWSPWIVNVDWTDYRKQLSHWSLKKFGISLSWNAVNHTVIPPRLICWKTLDSAVRQAGRAVFRPVSPYRTSIELTCSFIIPRLLSVMFRSNWVDQQVQQTIKSDLLRFNEFVKSRIHIRPHATLPRLCGAASYPQAKTESGGHEGEELRNESEWERGLKEIAKEGAVAGSHGTWEGPVEECLCKLKRTANEYNEKMGSEGVPGNEVNGLTDVNHFKKSGPTTAYDDAGEPKIHKDVREESTHAVQADIGTDYCVIDNVCCPPSEAHFGGTDSYDLDFTANQSEQSATHPVASLRLDNSSTTSPRRPLSSAAAASVKVVGCGETVTQTAASSPSFSGLENDPLVLEITAVTHHNGKDIEPNADPPPVVHHCSSALRNVNCEGGDGVGDGEGGLCASDGNPVLPTAQSVYLAPQGGCSLASMGKCVSERLEELEETLIDKDTESSSSRNVRWFYLMKGVRGGCSVCVCTCDSSRGIVPKDVGAGYESVGCFADGGAGGSSGAQGGNTGDMGGTEAEEAACKEEGGGSFFGLIRKWKHKDKASKDKGGMGIVSTGGGVDGESFVKDEGASNDGVSTDKTIGYSDRHGGDPSNASKITHSTSSEASAAAVTANDSINPRQQRRLSTDARPLICKGCGGLKPCAVWGRGIPSVMNDEALEVKEQLTEVGAFLCVNERELRETKPQEKWRQRGEGVDRRSGWLIDDNGGKSWGGDLSGICSSSCNGSYSSNAKDDDNIITDAMMVSTSHASVAPLSASPVSSASSSLSSSPVAGSRYSPSSPCHSVHPHTSCRKDDDCSCGMGGSSVTGKPDLLLMPADVAYTVGRGSCTADCMTDTNSASLGNRAVSFAGSCSTCSSHRSSCRSTSNPSSSTACSAAAELIAYSSAHTDGGTDHGGGKHIENKQEKAVCAALAAGMEAVSTDVTENEFCVISDDCSCPPAFPVDSIPPNNAPYSYSGSHVDRSPTTTTTTPRVAVCTKEAALYRGAPVSHSDVLASNKYPMASSNMLPSELVLGASSSRDSDPMSIAQNDSNHCDGSSLVLFVNTKRPRVLSHDRSNNPTADNNNSGTGGESSHTAIPDTNPVSSTTTEARDITDTGQAKANRDKTCYEEERRGAALPPLSGNEDDGCDFVVWSRRTTQKAEDDLSSEAAVRRMSSLSVDPTACSMGACGDHNGRSASGNAQASSDLVKHQISHKRTCWTASHPITTAFMRCSSDIKMAVALPATETSACCAIGTPAARTRAPNSPRVSSPVSRISCSASSQLTCCPAYLSVPSQPSVSASGCRAHAAQPRSGVLFYRCVSRNLATSGNKGEDGGASEGWEVNSFHSCIGGEDGGRGGDGECV